MLYSLHENTDSRTSLMIQWLRIYLPMPGTQIQSLVQEDPTCCGATKPVLHNTEPHSRAHRAQLLKPECLKVHALPREKPPQREARASQQESSPHSPQLEKANLQQGRIFLASATKIKMKF